jgi:hypothetical protein
VVVSVLLAPDPVELFLPGDLDGHGWREGPPEGTRPYWKGAGNLQLAVGGQGGSDPRGTGGGGRGPHDPATIMSGTLYLPPDAEPLEGATARVRGKWYALSQVRLLGDPQGGEGIDCFTATATEARHA